jgi:hypothetical protein
VPAATTEKVAVCPEIMVWLEGCVVIVGATGSATPEAVTTTGALRSLLEIVMVPESLPIVGGAKLAEKVVLCPVDSVMGSVGPVTVMPVPDAVACEIVTATVPELVSVTLCLLVDPTATAPKFTTVGLGVRVPVGVESELVEDAVLALVTPTHPDCVRTPARVNMRANKIKGLRLLVVSRPTCPAAPAD